jgi:hypothetical protein
VKYQWGARDSGNIATSVSVCGVCNGGLLVKTVDKGSTAHANLISTNVDFPGARFRVLDTWPKYHSQAPDFVAANVGRFYEQGLENLQHKRWDAAGAMFRKSLDVATKALAPEHKSETLFKRINKMVAAGQLTPAMGDWSHEIRLEGNDAVHDDEPETEDDARAAQKFAEAFLTYVYTLPEMVRANRAKREPPTE